MVDEASRKRQVTIKTVAEEAGGSIQTISRVLNNRPDVTPKTKQKTQKIIEKFGSFPWRGSPSTVWGHKRHHLQPEFIVRASTKKRQNI